MWQAWCAGDIATAWWTSRALDPVCKACFVETNPVPVKLLLYLNRLCEFEPRLPLAPASEDTSRFLSRFQETVLAELMQREVQEAEA
jgi:dihydrodipicolinate synthase/N-acetylneuraminate lyase